MHFLEHRIGSRLLTLVHLAAWLLVLGIYLSIFEYFIGWQLALLRGLANAVPMAALFYLNLWLLRRWFETRAYVGYGLLVVVSFLLCTFVRTAFNLLFPVNSSFDAIVQQPISLLIGSSATNLIVLFLSGFYHVLNLRYQTEHRNLALQNEQREAQLRFLRTQINPHFLFNTLHNIYSLAVVRSEKTAPMILKLSNLLRYVTYDGQSGRVALQQEIDQIRDLIDLFQMRSEAPRDIELSVTGDPAGLMIEPMVLVPLIENCFKHGNLDADPAAYVRIALRIESDRLHFEAVNTKDDADRQKDDVGGVGLVNIRKRLALQYPDRHQFAVAEQPTTFTVRLILRGLDVQPLAHPVKTDRYVSH